MKSTSLFLLFFCLFHLPLFSQCEIGELSIDESACLNGEFSVIIDFDHANTSDSFIVRGNGHTYGCFAYPDLPITIDGLDGDCDTEYEFVVIDKRDPNCRREGVLGEVCCVCRIYDIGYDITDCNDHQEFSVELDFLYENTSDSFSISWRGMAQGCFAYNDLPVTFGPFDGDCTTSYGFLIRDKEHLDCLEDFGIGEVCCEEECEIFDIEVETIECNGDSCMVVELNFLHNATGSMGFDVFGRNGLIGHFQYNQLPLRIPCFPLSGHQFELVEICDRELPDCCGREEFEALVCDSTCRINDLIVEPFDCDSSGNFLVEFDFEYQNVSDSFKLTVNGHQLGTYNYDSLAIVAGPIEGGCDSRLEFVVFDCLDSLCADTVVLEGTCCEEEECRLYELVVEPFECDSNNTFLLEIDFLYENVSDSFDVTVNGHPQGRFAYSDLAVVIGRLEGGCDSRHVIEICDSENEDCCVEKVLEGTCCEEEECRIYEIEYELTRCDSNDMFEVVVNFNYEHVSDSFQIEYNRSVLGCYAYADLPVRFGPFLGDCHTPYGFIIRDKENGDCLEDFGIGEVCCNECDLYDLEYEVTECDSLDQFQVIINFLYVNTSDSFSIMGNGHNYGCFAYADLPVTLGPLEGDCDTNFEFIIRDKEKERCAIDFGIGEVCCEEECRLYELVVEPFECDTNNTFLLEIDFLYENVSDSFDVTVNGHPQGRFAYSDLAVVIGRLEGGCDSRHVIEICDSENRDCCVEKVIEGTCCEEEECRIYEIEYELTRCDSNDMFEVVVNFDYEHVSDSFQIEYNRSVLGCYAYADLPVRFGPFLGDCHTPYGFIIRDKENGDCLEDFGIGEICCNECDLYDLEYEVTECDSLDQFQVIINFLYVNTSDSFSIMGNGHNYGCFAYADLPVTLGPLEGDCDTNFEFIIRDKEKERCAIDFGIGEVCCEEECRLYELVVEPFECDTNNTFLLEIDFLYENVSDSFDVTVNGHPQGRFAYSDLAVVIGRLEGGCDSRHVIEICDSENEHCCIEEVIEGTCCDRGCSIGELEAEALECNGDSCLYVKVDFEHSGTGENFNVYDRQGLIGTYSYGSLPLTIDCYPISGLDQEYIRVCDEDQEDCCAVMEFDGLDCSTIGTFDLEDFGWTVTYSFPTSTFQLENNGASAAIELYLFNIEGKQIVRREYQSNDALNISHLKSGVYVVAINVGGYIEHRKVVKL